MDKLAEFFSASASIHDNTDEKLKNSSHFENTDKFKQQVTALFSSYDSNNKFKDTIFNPLNKLPDDSWTLKRTTDYKPSEGGVELVGEISVENCYQGKVGNCYMLQVLLAIACKYPEKIRECFPFPDLIKKGVVVVKFWSQQDKKWRLIFTDDQLPAKEEDNVIDWFGISPVGKLKNEFWINFIEKSMAYAVGNYQDLDAGAGKFGVEAVYTWVLGPNEYRVVDIPNGMLDKKKRMEISLKMVEDFKEGSVISLSSQHSKDFINKKTGLVHFHGYSLVDIRENVAGSGFTLVKCLNVWGRNGEWIGDWSDDSKLWKKHPKVAEELRAEEKNDGQFWIDIKDFHVAFCLIWMALPISEEKLKLDCVDSVVAEQTSHKSVCVNNKEFKFKIINDAKTNFKLFWINYEGLEAEYATVNKSAEVPMTSYAGNKWSLKNLSHCLVFTLGEKLFEKNNCAVLASDMLKEYK